MSEALFAAQHGWIRVAGAGPLLAPLQLLAPVWPCRRPSPKAHVVAAIGAANDGGAWRFTCDAYAVPDFRFDDPLAAANGLLGTLLGCTVALERRLASLHAAAVQLAGGVLLLLGENGAGKSTLSVALTQAGHRFVSDDRSLLRLSQRPRVIGMQLTGKLRQPLPSEAGTGFREFVAARAVLQSEAMSIVRFRPQEELPRGATARLMAAVLLQRDGSAQPILEPVSRTDLLDALLAACFAPQLTAVERLQALLPVADLPAYSLQYANAIAAAAHLSRHFA